MARSKIIEKTAHIVLCGLLLVAQSAHGMDGGRKASLAIPPWVDLLFKQLPDDFPEARKREIKNIIARTTVPSPAQSDFVKTDTNPLFLPPHQEHFKALGLTTLSGQEFTPLPGYHTRWFREILRAEGAPWHNLKNEVRKQLAYPELEGRSAIKEEQVAERLTIKDEQVTERLAIKDRQVAMANSVARNDRDMVDHCNAWAQHYQDQVKNLEEQIEDYGKQIDLLSRTPREEPTQKKVEELEEEMDVLKNMIKDQYAKILKLEEEKRQRTIKDLTKQLTANQEDLATQTNLVNPFSAPPEQLKKLNTELEAGKVELTEKLEQFEKLKSETMEWIEQQRQLHRQLQSTHNDQLEQLKKQSNELTDENDANASRITDRTKQLAQLEKQKSSLKQLIGKNRQATSSSQVANANQLAQLNQQNQEFEARTADLTKQVAQLKKRKETLEKEHDASSSQITDLTTQLEKLGKQKAELIRWGIERRKEFQEKLRAQTVLPQNTDAVGAQSSSGLATNGGNESDTSETRRKKRAAINAKKKARKKEKEEEAITLRAVLESYALKSCVKLSDAQKFSPARFNALNNCTPEQFKQLNQPEQKNFAHYIAGFLGEDDKADNKFIFTGEVALSTIHEHINKIWQGLTLLSPGEQEKAEIKKEIAEVKQIMSQYSELFANKADQASTSHSTASAPSRDHEVTTTGFEMVNALTMAQFKQLPFSEKKQIQDVLSTFVMGVEPFVFTGEYALSNIHHVMCKMRSSLAQNEDLEIAAELKVLITRYPGLAEKLETKVDQTPASHSSAPVSSSSTMDPKSSSSTINQEDEETIADFENFNSYTKDQLDGLPRKDKLLFNAFATGERKNLQTQKAFIFTSQAALSYITEIIAGCMLCSNAEWTKTLPNLYPQLKEAAKQGATKTVSIALAVNVLNDVTAEEFSTYPKEKQQVFTDEVTQFVEEEIVYPRTGKAFVFTGTAASKVISDTLDRARTKYSRTKDPEDLKMIGHLESQYPQLAKTGDRAPASNSSVPAFSDDEGFLKNLKDALRKKKEEKGKKGPKSDK